MAWGKVELCAQSNTVGLGTRWCVRNVLQVGERAAGAVCSAPDLSRLFFGESVLAEEGGGGCLSRTLKQCLTFLLKGAS